MDWVEPTAVLCVEQLVLQSQSLLISDNTHLKGHYPFHKLYQLASI